MDEDSPPIRGSDEPACCLTGRTEGNKQTQSPPFVAMSTESIATNEGHSDGSILHARRLSELQELRACWKCCVNDSCYCCCVCVTHRLAGGGQALLDEGQSDGEESLP